MKNFFVNYRRRFNLEEVLQEWEAEQGTQESNGISPTAGEERKPTVNSLASKSPDVDEKVVYFNTFTFVSVAIVNAKK